MSAEILKLQEALRELIKRVEEDSPHSVDAQNSCSLCKALTEGAKLLPEYEEW